MKRYIMMATLLLFFSHCGNNNETTAEDNTEDDTSSQVTDCATSPDLGTFVNEEKIEIVGYDDHVMEVSVSTDGEYLFFNDREAQTPQKDLYWAERIDDTTYQYKGKISGVNSDSVDASPDMDSSGNFYYTSLVDYANDQESSLRVGRFEEGVVTGSEIIQGDIYVGEVFWVSLDPDVTPDGSLMVFSEGYFQTEPPSIMNIRLANKVGDKYFIDSDQDEILKNINTDNLEYAPTISSDGRELFFTRVDKSSDDVNIMVARRNSTDETFCQPQAITVITGFVEAPSLSADEKTLYYHKLDDEGKFSAYKVTRE